MSESKSEEDPSGPDGARASGRDPDAARHFIAGWTGIAVFLTLGLALETMHAFKSQWFLHPDHETRRLLLRLGHAHGTGLSLLALAFGATLSAVAPAARPGLRRPGALVVASLVLIPGGFLLGGLSARGGDPGLGIVLVPTGALLLFVGVVGTLRVLVRQS